MGRKNIAHPTALQAQGKHAPDRPNGSITFLFRTYMVQYLRLGEPNSRRIAVIDDVIGVDALIDALIEREGGYVFHPADRGGATCFGITEAVARAHGYVGAMANLPREEAVTIYRRLYWLRPHYDEVAERAPRVAAELFDTGANMGPAVATTFLQRALTALNRNARDYPDLTPDGRVGPRTLAALETYLEKRGKRCGETVLLRALEALQGERYLRLAERRPANEAFLYGWLANRIG
jgi:lysozyme family protein